MQNMATLIEDGHVGKLYTLTGPEALTNNEAAQILSTALGRQIRFINLPPEQLRPSLLSAGMPSGVRMLCWICSGSIARVKQRRLRPTWNGCLAASLSTSHNSATIIRAPISSSDLVTYPLFVVPHQAL